MASNDRIVYGIHSMAPYRRSDHLPFGILKIIGGGTLSLSAEFEDLFGGSNKFAWASEAKTISSEFTATVKSMPDFLFEVYLGASTSTIAAAALGSIVDPAVNVKGTSIVATTSGITGVTVKAGSEADLKDGKYLLLAKGADEVDVYMYTDIAHDKGTDISFEDDLLKITSSTLVVPAGGTVDIPDCGLEITGEFGPIAFTIGDTAEFRVSAAHGGVSEITVGKSATTFPEHGFVALSAKRSDGSLFEIEVFKAVGSGFPIALEETVFSIPELTIKLCVRS